MNKPEWMLTENELNQIIGIGGTPKDYQRETSILQAKKLLEYLIRVHGNDGALVKLLFEPMLKQLDMNHDHCFCLLEIDGSTCCKCGEHKQLEASND